MHGNYSGEHVTEPRGGHGEVRLEINPWESVPSNDG